MYSKEMNKKIYIPYIIGFSYNMQLQFTHF